MFEYPVNFALINQKVTCGNNPRIITNFDKLKLVNQFVEENNSGITPSQKLFMKINEEKNKFKFYCS